MQTWIYCPRNGGLVELGGQTFERWDFVVTKYGSFALVSLQARR